MRPQLAMAALLLLVIGSSLLLLRTRPGEQKHVLVTERGVPEGEPETVAVVPRAPAAAARSAARDEKEERRGEEAKEERRADSRAAERAPASKPEVSRDEPPSPGDRAYEEALGAYRDRKYEEAQRRFAEVAASGGSNAASAALYEAQSARARSGCPTAAPLFDEVYRKYPDSQPGREAAWQAASCYRTLGDFERARHDYEALLSTPGYADRAQAALASLGDSETTEVAAKTQAAGKAASAAPAARRSLRSNASPAAPPPAASSP